MLRFNTTVIPQNTNQKNFNTSYVTVQQGFTQTKTHVIEFQYILCYGSTAKYANGNNIIHIFQYILCYGSTWWKEVIKK